MMASSPTAQTSLEPLPQMLLRARVVGLGALLHAYPSQCKSVPANPTAQTSHGLLPHAAVRMFVVPLGIEDQTPPSQCRIAPFSPTAQTSLGEAAHTPFSDGALSGCTGDQP